MPPPDADADAPANLDLVRAYATAYAWHSALNARLSSIDVPWADENRADMTIANTGNSCSFRIDPDPMPRYPMGAELSSQVGAVVVLFHTDANGAVTRRELLATAPANADFDDAVRRAFQQWQVVRRPDSPPNCSMETKIFAPITFSIEDF